MKTLEEYVLAKIDALEEQVGMLAALNDQYSGQLAEKAVELNLLIGALKGHARVEYNPIYGSEIVIFENVSQKYDSGDFQIISKYFKKELSDDQTSEAEASEA